MFLSQESYVKKMLDEFNFEEKRKPKPNSNLFTPSVHEPMTSSAKAKDAKEKAEAESILPYRRVVGLLMYLQICTRPDISKSVSDSARFSAEPGLEAVTALKRILRYLRGTSGYGIRYTRTPGRPRGVAGNFDLTFYADSDFAACPITRRSRSGGLIECCGGPVFWWSRLQPAVTLSTCEAEMLSLIEMTKEAIALHPTLVDMGIVPADSAITILQDNQSTIAVARQHSHSRRTKHYELKFMFLVELIEDKRIDLQYCRTAEMLADGLTKSLQGSMFVNWRDAIGVVPVPKFGDSTTAKRATAVKAVVGDSAVAVKTLRFAGAPFTEPIAPKEVALRSPPSNSQSSSDFNTPDHSSGLSDVSPQVSTGFGRTPVDPEYHGPRTKCVSTAINFTPARRRGGRPRKRQTTPAPKSAVAGTKSDPVDLISSDSDHVTAPPRYTTRSMSKKRRKDF